MNNDNYCFRDHESKKCSVLLDELKDVNLFVNKDKEVLTYDEGLKKWTNKPVSITSVNGIKINKSQDGQALVYNSIKERFENKFMKLSSMDDIKITNPMTDQVLKFDGEKWINKDEDDFIAKNAYKSIKEIKNYLYELEYDYINYYDAFKYFKERFAPKIAGCTSIRKDNWYGRNYDWYYDNSASFVIRIKGTDNRYSSIGVSSSLIDNDVAKNKEYSEYYKYIPFALLDGINEKGVIGSLNIVPFGDGGYTTGTIPKKEKKFEISAFMLLRFVLDNFATATDAVEYIRDYVSVYSANNERVALELHFIFADERNTYLIEFMNNELILSELTDRTYMTNFYITGMELNEDGTAKWESLTPHAEGVERYDYITKNIANVNSMKSMRNMMEYLKFTHAYDVNFENYWWTELCGQYKDIDLTVTTDRELFIPIRNKFIEYYENRDRNNPITWQTVHSSVYDIYNRRLKICVQEELDEFTFDLNPTYTKSEIDEKISSIMYMIAQEFSNSSVYHENDLCIFNNKLYQFIANKGAGSWSYDVVRETTIANILNR